MIFYIIGYLSESNAHVNILALPYSVNSKSDLGPILNDVMWVESMSQIIWSTAGVLSKKIIQKEAQ